MISTVEFSTGRTCESRSTADFPFFGFFECEARFGDTFHDIYRRNSQPTPCALNPTAKIKAEENDALRLAPKITARQRPTITAYSNIKAPEPQPAVIAATTAPNIINISGATVVINQ